MGPIHIDLEQDLPIVTHLGSPPTLASHFSATIWEASKVSGSAPSRPHRKKEKIKAKMSNRVHVMTNFCRVHQAANSLWQICWEIMGSQPPHTINNFISQLSQLSLTLLEARYHDAIERLLEKKERQHAVLEMPLERRLEWLYCL